jgi:hypothetical protein
MTRTQFWIATALGALALILLGHNVWLINGNRQLQQDIGERQQFVQQSVQLEGLYREIVRALAELTARNNDADLRNMLARHGLTVTVNAPAPGSAPAAAPAQVRK